MFLLPWGNSYNGNQHFLEFVSELILFDTPPDLWSLAMSEVKISLRSKNYVNVSEIAKKFNGGGHIRAAGYSTKLPLEEAKEKIINQIKNYLK